MVKAKEKLLEKSFASKKDASRKDRKSSIEIKRMRPQQTELGTIVS